MTIPTLLLLTVAAPFTAQAETALDWATGTWGRDLDTASADQQTSRRTCQTSPIIVTIDKENMRYKAVHTGEDDFVGAATILETHDRWITLQYDNEKRTLKNGICTLCHPTNFIGLLAKASGKMNAKASFRHCGFGANLRVCDGHH